VRDLSIEVRAGEVVALLGANGAGKTTTLLSLSGDITPISGEVRWLGRRTSAPLYRRARSGLRLITEERSVFMGLSVADNLRLAHRDPSACLELFLELRGLMSSKAGLLSGGEQHMLTLARARRRMQAAPGA
jgi:branched-chain amino acid transport system ATP-binding protein